jgi:hypothetical protein
VAAQQVGEDAEQPRPRARRGDVVPVPPGECHQERLGDQVLGQIPADPAGAVVVQGRAVPVEQLAEQFGGTGDEVGIRADGQ